MKTLIIFNHPYEHSFCHAILQACQKGLKEAGKESHVINLDKERFNPVMSADDLRAFATAHNNPKEAMATLDSKVLQYKKHLQQAEHIVFIYPIWWMLMPALTKGFIDKVFFPGIAYTYGDNGQMQGTLTNIKQVTVITTMATAAETYEKVMCNAMWKALHYGTFKTIGLDNCKWINFDRIKESSPEVRNSWLLRIEEYFSGI